MLGRGDVRDGHGGAAKLEAGQHGATASTICTTTAPPVAAGKLVRLEGIGTLKAPVKEAAAGFPSTYRVKRRKVEIKGTVVWKGDPYPDQREKPKIAISGGPRP
ncbi:hypothetical protein [Sphingomonas rubra]|uniref:Uncharacterized protein n=1 Tax=Sphingomonas rubra TaxID=634430 RepID=A0A1I5RVE4_9SPHN|nr:hypothetical protein [Sphingomonas rubra]SFP62397.1 hypothetical protein SAMN04488241_104150 [Sphingomonas rubra]